MTVYLRVWNGPNRDCPLLTHLASATDCFLVTLPREAPQELCLLLFSLLAGIEALPCMESLVTWACMLPIVSLNLSNRLLSLFCWKGFYQGQLFTFCKISVTFKADNNDLKPDPGLIFEKSKDELKGVAEKGASYSLLHVILCKYPVVVSTLHFTDRILQEDSHSHTKQSLRMKFGEQIRNGFPY